MKANTRAIAIAASALLAGCARARVFIDALTAHLSPRTVVD